MFWQLRQQDKYQNRMRLGSRRPPWGQKAILGMVRRPLLRNGPPWKLPPLEKGGVFTRDPRSLERLLFIFFLTFLFFTLCCRLLLLLLLLLFLLLLLYLLLHSAVVVVVVVVSFVGVVVVVVVVCGLLLHLLA